MREGKREPTAEQTAFSIAALMLVPGRELTGPTRRESYEALRNSAAELRKELDDAPPATRAEAEKLLAAYEQGVAQLHLTFGEPSRSTSGPATTATTATTATAPVTREQQLQALRRMKDLPRNMRRFIELQATAQYHSRRLRILQNIERLRTQAGQEKDAAQKQDLQARLAAQEELLKALDQLHDAQQQVIRLTPLGQLEESDVGELK